MRSKAPCQCSVLTHDCMQIRHMVAAAVQVARGSIPLAFIEASLRRPSRATYPLAPSQVRLKALLPGLFRVQPKVIDAKCGSAGLL